MSSTVYDIIENRIDAMLTALWYDYSNKYITKTLNDIVYMITTCGTRKCTEVASYIFKVLVLSYGDYGVSPAVGWIADEYKSYLLTAIDKWREDMHV